MENHHFEWENQLFLWPFSIAFCMFTRPGIIGQKPNTDYTTHPRLGMFESHIFQINFVGPNGSCSEGSDWESKENHLGFFSNTLSSGWLLGIPQIQYNLTKWNLDWSVCLQRPPSGYTFLLNKWVGIWEVIFQLSNQWPFQDPKLEVPTIYKAYIIWPYMVLTYLHFRILKFPLIQLHPQVRFNYSKHVTPTPAERIKGKDGRPWPGALSVKEAPVLVVLSRTPLVDCWSDEP